ncbi:MAG: dihydropteroate synthase [Bacteroidales bacterium]|nr:dihydropteroate synthase [Bacteroidales bacterium]
MNQLTDKNTAFSATTTIKFGSKQLVKKGPLVMGILNLTPDSFFDGGRHSGKAEMLQQVSSMLSDGADLIDIGAMSTRPGASEVSEQEELDRLLPALEILCSHFPEVLFSIDTYRSGVAMACIKGGAGMINDISGGTFDPAMAEFIGQQNIPFVLMHIHGQPRTMQENPMGDQVTAHVIEFLRKQLAVFIQAGASQLFVDPGFGFGKSLGANYVLLSEMHRLRALGFPILVGLSRKSMIYKLLEITPEEALNGTSVLHSLALMQGASILRVHDVKEAVQTIHLLSQVM